MKISLWRRHALTVADGAFSHKIGYVPIFQENLNLEGHLNCITGSKVTAILLNGVDFAHWWSFIGKGLRLEPAQQACFLMISPSCFFVNFRA